MIETLRSFQKISRTCSQIFALIFEYSHTKNLFIINFNIKEDEVTHAHPPADETVKITFVCTNPHSHSCSVPPHLLRRPCSFRLHQIFAMFPNDNKVPCQNGGFEHYSVSRQKRVSSFGTAANTTYLIEAVRNICCGLCISLNPIPLST